MKTIYAALICGAMITMSFFGIALPKIVESATVAECAALARAGVSSKWCAANGYATIHATGLVR